MTITYRARQCAMLAAALLAIPAAAWAAPPPDQKACDLLTQADAARIFAAPLQRDPVLSYGGVGQQGHWTSTQCVFKTAKGQTRMVEVRLRLSVQPDPGYADFVRKTQVQDGRQPVDVPGLGDRAFWVVDATASPPSATLHAFKGPRGAITVEVTAAPGHAPSLAAATAAAAKALARLR